MLLFQVSSQRPEVGWSVQARIWLQMISKLDANDLWMGTESTTNGVDEKCMDEYIFLNYPRWRKVKYFRHENSHKNFNIPGPYCQIDVYTA